MSKIISIVGIMAVLLMGCGNQPKNSNESKIADTQISDTMKTETVHYMYKTQGTCSKSISFDITGNVITNIHFERGCNGNLKAISKLVDGWTVEQIEEKLKGNTCDVKTTSCADQLAIAVREAYEKTK